MKIKVILGVLSALFLLDVAFAIPMSRTAAQVPSDSQSQCPAPSFVRGFDKETGEVVCGHVTGCPYGDSIPLGDQCEKARIDQEASRARDIAPVETPPVTDFGGK